MNEQIWLAMALARLAVRAEMLEQENAALRLEIGRMKGPQEVAAPEKETG